MAETELSWKNYVTIYTAQVNQQFIVSLSMYWRFCTITGYFETLKIIRISKQHEQIIIRIKDLQEMSGVPNSESLDLGQHQS